MRIITCNCEKIVEVNVKDEAVSKKLLQEVTVELLSSFNTLAQRRHLHTYMRSHRHVSTTSS